VEELEAKVGKHKSIALLFVMILPQDICITVEFLKCLTECTSFSISWKNRAEINCIIVFFPRFYEVQIGSKNI